MLSTNFVTPTDTVLHRQSLFLGQTLKNSDDLTILFCVVQFDCMLLWWYSEAVKEKAEAEASLEEQEVAATKIQALFRGIHDRAKVEAMKQEQVLSSPLSTTEKTRQLLDYRYFLYMTG